MDVCPGSNSSDQFSSPGHGLEGADPEPAKGRGAPVVGFYLPPW